ncbi:MAG TPA: hypothetical protein VJR50_04135 [Mycobacterium sp.]|jgi:hypothetical protein|nr:hypothetical protein [Mycobacterium sp.]
MPLIARRIAAVLAAISAALHAVMLGHAGNVASTVLTGAMAGVCLYCARELWLSDTTRAWTLVALMNLVMVAVHLPMSGQHHVTRATMEAVVPQSFLMTLATGLSMVEVVIAVAVLLLRSRGNAQAISLPE